ncbi:MAG TPA: hypothetical protein VMN36_01860 [Verrucomicrobiales bacterium]|nr:hypothetical protein [Verrucomicrobiales bacterium]
MIRKTLLLTAILHLAAAGTASLGAEEPEFDFTRMTAHWDAYGDPVYLDFIAEARPELVQAGFYGAHFYSLAHTPEFGGYPAHFPVRGLTEGAEWFGRLNEALHARGAKVVGHFNVEFLIGDPESPEGPRGFFKWYREDWDESLLGPKPVEDPVDLLEKQADGSPIVNRSYAIGGMNEYWACLRNPAWRQVLTAWVRRGVALGVDGYIVNYFYRHDCVCPHCQRAFRDYLTKRFSSVELRERFGVEDLAGHTFPEIVSWHDPEQSTPLRLEMLRFSQVSNKEVFDEVFVRFGRSLKPGLILAQWNHLGDFSAISGDERCLLPDSLWGRDETYLWYSTGGAANFTDLKNGFLGDATLQARYIRGAFRDKPFTLGKYEATRVRTAIAELAANGGAPMGFYTRFTDPEARREIVRYYGFLRRYEELYRGNMPHAEAVFLYPRNAVHRGELEALQAFREEGRALLGDHVLFAVLPDDALDRAPPGLALLAPGSGTPPPADRSRFAAPATLQVSASRPFGACGEIDFHFVNYNREEPPPGPDGAPSPGTGIAGEKPIPAGPLEADCLLPAGAEVAGVQFITPEDPDPQEMEWTAAEGRLRFRTPGFAVYGVARVLLR